MEASDNLKHRLSLIAQEVSYDYDVKQEWCAFEMHKVREQLHQFTPKITGALMMLELPEYRVDLNVASYWFQHTDEGVVYGDLNAYIEGVTSWKQVEPVFVALQAAGMELDRWTSGDDAPSYTRVFRYANFFRKNVGIQIHATLTGDTDECRRVLVGYNEPIRNSGSPRYELRCKES